MVLKPANLLFLLFVLSAFLYKNGYSCLLWWSKSLEWSLLIINCMLIIFLTAIKAIQLYLIGTSSRFLMFSGRIYSCKKQNNAKKSQTAHAGMAASPTATAHTHSDSGTGTHNECFCWQNCTMSFVFFSCRVQMGTMVSLWVQCHGLPWTLFKWHVQTWLKISAVNSATLTQIYFLLSLCSC